MYNRDIISNKKNMENKDELMLVLAILQGAKVYKKLPKFLTDEIYWYIERWGYENLDEAILEIKKRLNN